LVAAKLDGSAAKLGLKAGNPGGAPSKFGGISTKFGSAPAKSCFCCGGGGGEAIRSDPGTKPEGGAFVTNPAASAVATKSGAGTNPSTEAAAAMALNVALS